MDFQVQLSGPFFAQPPKSDIGLTVAPVSACGFSPAALLKKMFDEHAPSQPEPSLPAK